MRGPERSISKYSTLLPIPMRDYEIPEALSEISLAQVTHPHEGL